jgi:hypothetical protein
MIILLILGIIMFILGAILYAADDYIPLKLGKIDWELDTEILGMIFMISGGVLFGMTFFTIGIKFLIEQGGNV